MSPKHCPSCGTQGDCINSRITDTHVQRRYECGCGNRWSTKEVLDVEATELRKDKKRLVQLQATVKELLE